VVVIISIGIAVGVTVGILMLVLVLVYQRRSVPACWSYKCRLSSFLLYDWFIS